MLVTAAVLLLSSASLPSLAVAEASFQQQAPEGTQQYVAQFQNYLDKFMTYIPEPSKHDPVAAAEAKAGAMKMDVLTKDNWHDVLYGHVKETGSGAATPEEVWVLVTGGNKTCYGHCDRLEKAFNQTAAKFALMSLAPHTALVNCENQPILCNMWSASAGSVWIFDMLPPPSPISIWSKRFNTTTVTSEDLESLRETEGGYKNSKVEDMRQVEGLFHPFDGWFARNNLAVPAAYALWVMSLVPSWAFMVVVSFASRTMMSNRMQNQTRGQRPGAPENAAAAGQARQ